MSDNSTSSVTVTWSATGGAITTGGLYTAGSTAGSYDVIAVQQGGTKADTSAVTVTSATPPPANGTADPTLLPMATGQAKNVAAYTAFNVRGMAAGGSVQGPGDGGAGVEGDQRHGADEQPGGESRLLGRAGAGEPGVGAGTSTRCWCGWTTAGTGWWT